MPRIQLVPRLGHRIAELMQSCFTHGEHLFEDPFALSLNGSSCAVGQRRSIILPSKIDTGMHLSYSSRVDLKRNNAYGYSKH